MAISVTKDIRPFLRVVAPVIDFKKFRRNNYVEKICPICGRKFTAILDMKNPNPEQGVYCSHACMSRAAFRKLSKFVSNKGVKNFIAEKSKIIDKTISMMYNYHNIDRNLSIDDMRQECNVALFNLYARCIRNKRNPYELYDGYLYKILKGCLLLNQKERKAFESSTEEAVIEDYDDEGISNKIKSIYDIDKKLDIENILRKIYKLSFNNENVKMALLHAYLYESEKDLDNGRVFKDYCQKYFNIPDTSVWARVKLGTEHIFFNDYKNISKYVHINNLKNKYKFNELYWEELTEDELGKEIADLLDYYSGYTTCSVCGKRFKPECKAVLGISNPVCSKECKIIANKKMQERYRERRGQVTGTVKRKCSICGKEFEITSNAKGAKNVYCSDKCRAEANIYYQRKYKGFKESVTRTCALCGKTVETTNPKMKSVANFYCSDECRKEVKKMRQIKYREQQKNKRKG